MKTEDVHETGFESIALFILRLMEAQDATSQAGESGGHREFQKPGATALCGDQTP